MLWPGFSVGGYLDSLPPPAHLFNNRAQPEFDALRMSLTVELFDYAVIALQDAKLLITFDLILSLIHLIEAEHADAFSPRGVKTLHVQSRQRFCFTQFPLLIVSVQKLCKGLIAICLTHSVHDIFQLGPELIRLCDDASAQIPMPLRDITKRAARPLDDL